MKTKHIVLFSAVALISATACHKDKTTTEPTPVSAPTSAQVIADFCTHVAAPDYNDMYNNAISFQTAEATFYANPNDNDLNTMRTSWKAMRAAYESAEGFLIGPIATQNLDPDIDTWPVEQNDLDAILNGTDSLTVMYVANLQSTLRGFHPVEYLIFGTSGTAMASSFTVAATSTTTAGYRKKEYLHALTGDMVNLITQIKNSYVVGSSNDYATVLNSAGPSDTTYHTRKAALLDLVGAMSGICDEVGGSASDGKINSVYSSNPIDVTLQESYFSNNSWPDFTNNISGIKNVYMATYKGSANGHSMHDLVAAKNLTLDNTLQSKLDAAINAFGTAHLPFGQSVVSERTQVLNIMNAIRDLQDVLDDGTPNNNHDLADFMNQYVTD